MTKTEKERRLERGRELTDEMQRWRSSLERFKESPQSVKSGILDRIRLLELNIYGVRTGIPREEFRQYIDPSDGSLTVRWVHRNY